MHKVTNERLRDKWSHVWLEKPETIYTLKGTEFERLKEFNITSVSLAHVSRIQFIGKDAENLVWSHCVYYQK